MTSLPPGDDHPGLVGENDGLHPVAQAELGQQVADVGLDGRIAAEQGGGDLRVAAAAAARPFRPVALASVIVIVLQFALGGKAYYPGAVF